MKRREFLQKSLATGATLGASQALKASVQPHESSRAGARVTREFVPPAKLLVQAVDEDGKPAWARVEVRGPDGKMFKPRPALPTAVPLYPSIGPWYLGSFTMHGEAVVEVPPGPYTVIAERGTEYQRFEKHLLVAQGESAHLEIALKPWIRMSELGWWSGDLHVHRSPEDVSKLALAEDLNLSVLFMIWGNRNPWAGKPWPKDSTVEISPKHRMTLLNAEDERGGGAWMFHGLGEMIDMGSASPWYPPGIVFIRKARAQRSSPGALFPWFECEKPVWWEVPVVMALEPPDSLGVLHNHFTEYGIYPYDGSVERPRDETKYPGDAGYVEYSLNLYYRYLNLGFRIPPSAGSACGVLPNPLGYNRVYAKLDGPFSVDSWYDALRNGPSFVTNGPMLFFETAPLAGNKLHLKVEARAREPLDRVEIVANGQVIKQFSPRGDKQSFEAEVTIDANGYSWIASRCYVEAKSTIRMAHSRPAFLPGAWNSREDALFFLRWIDDLIEQTKADSKRFALAAERETVLALYDEARRFYLKKAGQSN